MSEQEKAATLPPLDTSGRLIQGWDPEDPAHWDSRIAWRTLFISTFTLFMGFSTWYLVSAIAPQLNNIGFNLSKAELYWLTSIAGLSGGILRLSNMFLPPIIGTRKLVSFSALLFLIPMVGWFFAVQDPSTPYWWLLCLSFLCGIGGGAFSGFMPSTAYFFPRRLSGTALGFQAGMGNFGVSFVQLIAPWLIGFSLLGTTFIAPQFNTLTQKDTYVHNIAIFLMPWAIVASIVAWIWLKDVPIKANFRQQMDIFGNKNTWILSIVYMMTYGTFAGFAAQLALLINNIYGANSTFAETIDPQTLPQGAAFAFLGPLIGALVRAAWGPLCDKFGGAIWTFIGCIGMTVSTLAATFFLTPSTPDEFWYFLSCMLIMFFFTGLANAGTFKQMPMILPKRQAGGVTGWTGGLAAFGPLIVGALLSMMAPTTFFIGCVVYFTISTVLVWIYYARPNAPFPG